jgi:hypothetical protein
MIRKQLYLGPREEAVLKEAAAGSGRSEADLVREAVIEYAARRQPAPAGDRAAWNDALSFMRSLAGRERSRSGPRRRVSRGRLYEEVLTRGRRHPR